MMEHEHSFVSGIVRTLISVVFLGLLGFFPPATAEVDGGGIVQLEVSQKFDRAPKLSLPEIERVSAALVRASSRRLRVGNQQAPVVLRVEVGGKPLSLLYGSSNNRLCTGASIWGSVTVRMSGEAKSVQRFGDTFEPPPAISGRADHLRDPTQAPFYRALWAVTEGPYSTPKPLGTDVLTALSSAISATWEVPESTLLTRALSDESWAVRRRAAEALGIAKCQDAVQALCNALEDTDSSVRLRVI